MARWRSMVPLCICLALASSAQEAPRSPASTGPSLIPRTREERENRYQAQHRIVLNMVVTDQYGTPVKGLKQDDFELLDNGQQRAIFTLRELGGSREAAPTHVVLMLDAVNNNGRDIGNDRKGIEQFLKRSQTPLTYPTSLAILSESGVRMFQPSRERGVLLDQLRMLSKGVHPLDCTQGLGASEQVFAPIKLGSQSSVADTLSDPKPNCLNTRFQRSLYALRRFATEQENVPGRVILAWIGPGWPLLSGPEFREDSKAIRENLFDNLVLVTTALREAQVTLDAVFSPDLYRKVELRTDHDNAFFNGVPSEDKVAASSLGLQVLAHQSGGQILTETKDLGDEIDKCMDDAEAYYALSFNSPAANGPGEFHALQVKVARTGMTVRTSTAYYAQP